MLFADVIADISHESVDRPFEYIIPAELENTIKQGSQVIVPFGRSNRQIKGFVINIKDRAEWDPSRLKSIECIAGKSVVMEGSMIELADYIKTSYGGTLSQALKTVLPVKQKSAPVIERYICLNTGVQEAASLMDKYAVTKKFQSRARLLKELINDDVLPLSIVRDRLNISDSVIKAMERDGILRIQEKENLRDAFNLDIKQEYNIVLNSEQASVSDDIWNRYVKGDHAPSLIRGVTGSGKTEVYISLIDRFIKQGKQAIVLIPEIALTYQTVMRFYKKFGSRISVINSRLTPAQKYDQIEKARKGEVDIIIGPRSALFTPFASLGIIIIDEEHEGTYQNENVPRYDARDVAIKRAELEGGIVVLGSATPSVESYYRAQNGRYRLYTLEHRAAGARLPQVEIVDLREELQNGNRSMVSARLDELIRDRLDKHEQIMLFINRRGYSSFVSCRNCGTALKCPHCDVTLKYHKNGKLICHYCGFEMPMVKKCPECGSKYIGTFGTGTQKVEEEIQKLYPQARTLRMDLDTTKEKNAHEKILSAFADREADILIGTQMIVKGHDFANVTLVGIMAADLSLYSSNYQAAEKTFQLITQAAGRAGRGAKAGNVVIQTYSPDNYAVKLGADQNYTEFYGFEMDYRKLLGYPPVMNMLGIMFTSADSSKLDRICGQAGELLDRKIEETEAAGAHTTAKIGPANAPIAKINDRYRKIIYLKSNNYGNLIYFKDIVEEYQKSLEDSELLITFDFMGQ